MYSCPTSTFGTFLINCAEHTFYIQDLEIEAEDMSEIGDQETDHGIVLLCVFFWIKWVSGASPRLISWASVVPQSHMHRVITRPIMGWLQRNCCHGVLNSQITLLYVHITAHPTISLSPISYCFALLYLMKISTLAY